MICLACYQEDVQSTCPDCGATLTVCDVCATDMGENFCPNCNKTTD